MDNIKPWIKNLETYIPGKTEENFIKLASNENNYGPSPKVKKHLKENVDFINKYPHKEQEVRERVAEYVGLEPENVILGNGSDEIIDMVGKVFKGPYLGTYPSFAAYKIFLGALGEEYKTIKLNSDFSFPVKRFLEEEAQVYFLCSPNNPTGEKIEKEKIREVLEEGKLTIVDEAYYEFSNDSVVSLFPDYDNLVVLRTFSKAFGLGGLRIGYGLANVRIIDLLTRVKPPFNVNSLAHEAALKALENRDYMENCVERIKKERKRLLERLKELCLEVYPSFANFLLVNTQSIGMSAEEFCNKLWEEKIIVRRFGEFKGFEGEYVRISIGRERENEKLLEALGEILN